MDKELLIKKNKKAIEYAEALKNSENVKNAFGEFYKAVAPALADFMTVICEELAEYEVSKNDKH